MHTAVDTADSSATVATNRDRKLAWTIPDLARHTDLCVATIYNEIRRGRLKAHKLGTATRILDGNAQEWMNAWPEADIGRKAG